MSIEENYDIGFVAGMALREKQIQQVYRPIIAVHKWFARRPGTLYRAGRATRDGPAGPGTATGVGTVTTVGRSQAVNAMVATVASNAEMSIECFMGAF